MKNFIKKLKIFLDKIKSELNKPDIQKIIKIISIFLLFLWNYYLATKKFKTEYLNLKVGDIAPYDIKAEDDIEYLDHLETQKRIEEAAKYLPLIFKLNESVAEENIKNAEKFFSNLKKINTENITNYPNLSSKTKEILLKNLYQIEKIVLNILSNIYKKGITSISKEEIKMLSASSFIAVVTFKDGKESINNVSIDEIYSITNFSPAEIVKKYYPSVENEIVSAVSEIIMPFISPNLFYDRIATEESIKDKIKSIEPVKKTFKKGKVILRYGEEITENTFNILTQLKKFAIKSSIKSIRGYFILLLLLFILVIFITVKYADKWFKENKYFFFLLTFTFLMVTINYLMLNTAKYIPVKIENSFFIPISLSAIILNNLTTVGISYVMVLLISLLTVFFTGLQFLDFVILLTVGFFTTFISSKIKKRLFIWYLGIVIALFYSIVVLAVSLINNYTHSQFINALFVCAFNSIISAILTTGLLPLFEYFFNILTEYRLLELSDLNLPIMKRLLIEAPGTYHHSIIVANLAEAAAQSINANPLLARVGGYYHDIGKIERPEYFIENSKDDTISSKHSNLKPSISGSIIKSHIKYGISLAKKLRLPSEVIDIITQHHGTTIITYFYKKGLEESDSETRDEILSNYQYEGPKPQTKEAAIIMLADSIEAATRALKKPSHPRIVSIVKDIIYTRFFEGQLDECPLTLRDLNNIAQTFIQVLSGIYHSRIEYPDKNEIEKLKNGN